MMTLRRVLIPLLILALGGLVGYLMREDPGYILIAWGDRALEMSLWVGLSALLLLVLGWLIIRRLGRLLLILKPNRRAQGIQQLEKGILAFLELKLGKAKRHLASGVAHSPLPWVNQLLLARIAQAEKDYPTVAEWLDKATQENPHMELASGLLLVLSAYESRQLDLALAHAKRLEQNHPNNPFVLRLLRDIHLRLEDWTELMALQPRLIKAGRRTAETWQIDMVNGLMAQRPPNAGSKLQKWWKQLSPAQQQDPDLRYAYLKALVALEYPHVALSALEQALNRDRDSRLLTLYSKLDTEPRERLRQAETWLRKHPRDARFMLALGRLCLQEGLWGKAHDYFREGVAIEALPELQLELARLEFALGHDEDSHSRLQSLGEQVLDLPVLPLPARSERPELLPEGAPVPADHYRDSEPEPAHKEPAAR